MALHSLCGIFDITSPWKAHGFPGCHSRLECRGSRRRRTGALRDKIGPCLDDFKLSAQARRVALPRVFFPVLTEAPVRRFLVRVRPQFPDIEVDAQSWARRQFD